MYRNDLINVYELYFLISNNQLKIIVIQCRHEKYLYASNYISLHCPCSM